jgi:hypothetical protein
MPEESRLTCDCLGLSRLSGPRIDAQYIHRLFILKTKHAPLRQKCPLPSGHLCGDRGIRLHFAGVGLACKPNPSNPTRDVRRDIAAPNSQRKAPAEFSGAFCTTGWLEITEAPSCPGHGTPFFGVAGTSSLTWDSKVAQKERLIQKALFHTLR